MTQERAPGRPRVFIADRGDASGRLDQAVVRRLADVPRISRTRVQRWIGDSLVLVNGRPVRRASSPVAVGDRVEVLARDASVERAAPKPEPVALDVLYEDDYLLAINKPAGIIVHPSYKHASGTLLNALLAHVGETGAEPRLLQRLDKDTSGVLLVSKSREVHARLQRAMHAGSVRKLYLALVFGRPRPAAGTIALPLGRDPQDRRRVAVDPRGRQSTTRYRLLRTHGGVSLVECELVTGRMHQIRVHLAARGWPIVGDRVYGDPSGVAKIRDLALADAAHAVPRQALHAWRVILKHPATGVDLQVTAPMPELIRTFASCDL